jgi:protein-L-isoaspartate O-methyltransferase
VLLDRDPESEDVIGPKLAGSRNTRELRHHLMSSEEFRANNPDAASTGERTVVIKELESPGSARLFIDLSDVIGLAILRGQYEVEETLIVRRHLNPGDIAIDVGAHVGYFTMQMAEAVGPSGRVYAFEPLDSNADLLEQSVAENRFEPVSQCGARQRVRDPALRPSPIRGRR